MTKTGYELYMLSAYCMPASIQGVLYFISLDPFQLVKWARAFIPIGQLRRGGSGAEP